jgi:ATP-binding protein involved in chromosome partitioning
MLGIRGERPFMQDVDGKGMIVPIDVHGIKALSMGLLIDEKQAVVWRGPMASSAIKQFINDVLWGELDYLILDMPPGTGDVHLTMAQTIPITGAVIVTTPQEVAMADAKKAIMMFDNPQINVPLLGVIENMAYFTPEELPDNKYFIFGEGGGERLAEQFEIPYLGQVPLVMGIREGGDKGKPITVQENSIQSEIFVNISQEVARRVALRNANLPVTKVIEVTV